MEHNSQLYQSHFTFDISSQEPAARGLAFGENGNKLYVTGTSDTVWQYNLEP